MDTDPTTCEYDGTASSYNCQREEQCDDCFMVDHLKECAGCEHYDHPPIEAEALMDAQADDESKFGEERSVTQD